MSCVVPLLIYLKRSKCVCWGISCLSKRNYGNEKFELLTEKTYPNLNEAVSKAVRPIVKRKYYGVLNYGAPKTASRCERLRAQFGTSKKKGIPKTLTCRVVLSTKRFAVWFSFKTFSSHDMMIIRYWRTTNEQTDLRTLAKAVDQKILCLSFFPRCIFIPSLLCSSRKRVDLVVFALLSIRLFLAGKERIQLFFGSEINNL